jgi:hypothetical protein
VFWCDSNVGWSSGSSVVGKRRRRVMGKVSGLFSLEENHAASERSSGWAPVPFTWVREGMGVRFTAPSGGKGGGIGGTSVTHG